jgi:adenylate cyclase class IV
MPRELEKKYLIGSDITKVQDVIAKLNSLGYTKTKEESQTNHYFNFEGSNVRLVEALRDLPEALIGDTRLSANNKIASHLANQSISVRTRYTKGEQPLLCIKSSKKDSSNSNNRLETDFKFSSILSHPNEHSNGENKLDFVLIKRGLTIQAKWSRDRVVYQKNNFTVCIDKNAGYGYLVEVETIIDDNFEVNYNSDFFTDKALLAIDNIAKQLGLEELDSDRLNTMFKFYNENWRDYFGTDKVFEIK